MIVFVIRKREIILSQISLMKLVFFCKPRNDGWVRACLTTPDCPKPAVYGRSLLPCLLPIIRSWPLVTSLALQIISAQLHLKIRYLWTNLPSKLPQIRYSGTSIGQILGPQIRYFWTRNGLSFPGPAMAHCPESCETTIYGRSAITDTSRVS